MLRIVAALFLIAHGLVHLLYFAPPPENDPRYPFVPGDRWFARALGLQAGTAKTVAGTIATASTIAFTVSGIALLANAAVWEPAAVIGSGISVVLFALFFHRWLVFGIAIDLAIIASVLSWHVPASLFED